MPRYVILHHQFPSDSVRSDHYDLMLEGSDALSTWALPSPPTTGQSVIAAKLADHRTSYLNYEGPISGNRGKVARWDAGTFNELANAAADAAGSITLRMDGMLLHGILTLEAIAESQDQWRVTYCEES